MSDLDNFIEGQQVTDTTTEFKKFSADDKVSIDFGAGKDVLDIPKGKIVLNMTKDYIEQKRSELTAGLVDSCGILVHVAGKYPILKSSISTPAMYHTCNTTVGAIKEDTAMKIKLDVEDENPIIVLDWMLLDDLLSVFSSKDIVTLILNFENMKIQAKVKNRIRTKTMNSYSSEFGLSEPEFGVRKEDGDNIYSHDGIDFTTIIEVKASVLKEINSLSKKFDSEVTKYKIDDGKFIVRLDKEDDWFKDTFDIFSIKGNDNVEVSFGSGLEEFLAIPSASELVTIYMGTNMPMLMISKGKNRISRTLLLNIPAK